MGEAISGLGVLVSLYFDIDHMDKRYFKESNITLLVVQNLRNLA